MLSDAASEEERATCAYFAIGSMINDTSIRLRGLKPYKSVPTFILGQKLSFFGAAGMASIEDSEDPEQKTHGVLHFLTPEDMETLDKIEASYMRIAVVAHVYKPHDAAAVPVDTVTVGAYRIDPEKMVHYKGPSKPPTERYIDIITRGCRHFGIAEPYIQWLLSVEVVPRKKANEFQKFTHLPRIFGPCRVFATSDLPRWKGEDGQIFCLSVSGKVIRYHGDIKDAGPIRQRRGGIDMTLIGCRMIYEPLYPIVNSVEEMTLEHKAFVEDFLFGYTSGMSPGKWCVIGWLKEYGEPPAELDCIPYSEDNADLAEKEVAQQEA